MKHMITIIVAIALLPLATFAANSTNIPKPATSKTVPINRIVAVINDKVITQTTLNNAITMAKQQIEKRGIKMPSRKILQQQVLNQLIYRQIQLQIAARNNVKLTNAELNHAIGMIAKENKLTVNQLESQVQKSGISLKQFKQQIRDEATIAKLQQVAISPQIHITANEIQHFMKTYHSSSDVRTEYHLMNILVALSDTPTSKQVQTARVKAKNLVKQLRKGGNFKEIAMTNSNGQDALNGGDLGWRTLTSMPSLFAENVEGLKAGAVIGPIRAANGFHILKIAGLRNPGKQQLTKNQAREILFQRQFQEKLSNWLQEMRQQAYIKQLS